MATVRPWFPPLKIAQCASLIGAVSRARCDTKPHPVARYRGALVTLADISINLGILIGYCVDYWVRTKFNDNRNLSWRLAMALGATFPAV